MGAISGLDSVCAGDSIVLADTTAGGLWSASNANASVSAGRVKGISAGTDTIMYTVTNFCGQNTERHIVSVKLCPSLVGTINAIKNALNIYPNPGNGTFTLSLTTPDEEPAQVVITDVMGAQVKEISMTTNHPASIKLQSPPGVYFLNAVTAHGVWSEKVVINQNNISY